MWFSRNRLCYFLMYLNLQHVVLMSSERLPSGTLLQNYKDLVSLLPHPKGTCTYSCAYIYLKLVQPFSKQVIMFTYFRLGFFPLPLVFNLFLFTLCYYKIDILRSFFCLSNPVNNQRKRRLVLDKQNGSLKPILLIEGVRALFLSGMQASISSTSTHGAPTTPARMLWRASFEPPKHSNK